MKLNCKVLLYLFLLLTLAVSCKKKEKETPNVYGSSRFDGRMQRTAQDTAQILNETNKYVEALKAKQFDQALAMLCNFDDKGRPIPLTDDDKQSLMKVYKTYPVLNYSIAYFRIYSETDCEVVYKIEFFKKPKDMNIPNTISCILRPRRINGQWKFSVAQRFVEPNNNLEYVDTSKTVEDTANK